MGSESENVIIIHAEGVSWRVRIADGDVIIIQRRRRGAVARVKAISSMVRRGGGTLGIEGGDLAAEVAEVIGADGTWRRATNL